MNLVVTGTHVVPISAFFPHLPVHLLYTLIYLPMYSCILSGFKNKPSVNNLVKEETCFD